VVDDVTHAPRIPRRNHGTKLGSHFSHLGRSIPRCPDIVVNSTYWSAVDEVAAFEELVGSHGGMGGSQSFPFLLHPVELELPSEQLIGAEAVHRELRRWLVQLGRAEYQEP
jgi:hypothetical protein